MPEPPKVIWKGTPDEARDLEAAIQLYCVDCNYDVNFGHRVSTCAAHKALAEDQRFADGMIVYRHLRDDLMEAEGLDAYGSPFEDFPEPAD